MILSPVKQLRTFDAVCRLPSPRLGLGLAVTVTREGEPLSGKCDIHENLKKAFAWRAR